MNGGANAPDRVSGAVEEVSVGDVGARRQFKLEGGKGRAAVLCLGHGDESVVIAGEGEDGGAPGFTRGDGLPGREEDVDPVSDGVVAFLL